MKGFKTFVVGLVLAGWLSLILHSHPAHPRDLHQSHAGCQICSLADRISSKALPTDLKILSRPESIQTLVFHKPQSGLLKQTYYSNSSRAPPAA